MTPLESIQESLSLLGVAEEESEEFLKQTLLALRGWAGHGVANGDQRGVDAPARLRPAVSSNMLPCG